MRTISLFSGCGGMDVGASTAGADIIFANDIDQLACESLRQLSTHRNCHISCGDVANCDEFPEADLVLAGYPCQSFSMGGNRDPEQDERTQLYEHLARCLNIVQPKYFIAENVSGLRSLQQGKFLNHQKAAFSVAGRYGYHLSIQLLNAKDYGIPQNRKRLFIVGVRKDLEQVFSFPNATHGKEGSGLLPYTSHGEAIKGAPLWPEGDFYQQPKEENNFSWYFMSRNRKAKWHGPSYTIVANWRHITLHPASHTMFMHSSNLADGFKQEWRFSTDYEHLEIDPDLPTLDKPRRLSWQECALIQTFPKTFEPVGSTEEKIKQIGNAVPPKLATLMVSSFINETGLVPYHKQSKLAI